MATVPIYGTIDARQKDGKAVRTAQTYDDEMKKFQSVINRELTEAVASISETLASDAVTQSQLEEAEEVTAASLNDLDGRIHALETKDSEQQSGTDEKLDQILAAVTDIQTRLVTQEIEQENDEWLEM